MKMPYEVPVYIEKPVVDNEVFLRLAELEK